LISYPIFQEKEIILIGYDGAVVAHNVLIKSIREITETKENKSQFEKYFDILRGIIMGFINPILITSLFLAAYKNSLSFKIVPIAAFFMSGWLFGSGDKLDLQYGYHVWVLSGFLLLIFCTFIYVNNTKTTFKKLFSGAHSLYVYIPLIYTIAVFNT